MKINKKIKLLWVNSSRSEKNPSWLRRLLGLDRKKSQLVKMIHRGKSEYSLVVKTTERTYRNDSCLMQDLFYCRRKGWLESLLCYTAFVRLSWCISWWDTGFSSIQLFLSLLSVLSSSFTLLSWSFKPSFSCWTVCRLTVTHYHLLRNEWYYKKILCNTIHRCFLTS